MSVMSVFTDNDHSNPELSLRPYLLKIYDKLSGVLFEMHCYEGLEAELMSSESVEQFIKDYVSKTGVIVFSCVNTVLDFVIKNNLEFWAIGIGEDNIKNNTERIIKENKFEGLYSYIIGSGHKEFFETEIKPIIAEKFNRVTYYLDF
ncbi:hypothetical protein GF352_01925|nr:hypothetical protein [archaeon]